MLRNKLSVGLIVFLIAIHLFPSRGLSGDGGLLDRYKSLLGGAKPSEGMGKPVPHRKVAINELPFKNNHKRNLLYASQLYDAGDREVAFVVYRNMIVAYEGAGNIAYKADVHEALAYLFYEKDKVWEADARSRDEQRAWILSRNLEAVKELTEFLRCFSSTDLTQRNKNDARYDKNLCHIILCFEENEAWTMALDWIEKYESFRNPEGQVYDDKVDMIQYKKGEYYRSLNAIAEALVYYRQVAFGFGGDKQSEYAAQAAEKYKQLLSTMKPELYSKWLSTAQFREADNDWEGAICALLYAKRYSASQKEHDEAIISFLRRRSALLSKLLASVNEALDKHEWSMAKSGLVDCLRIAGEEPAVFSSYKACLLAERAESVAQEGDFVKAANLFRASVALAENKVPFEEREQEYESIVSRQIEEQLTRVRGLMADPNGPPSEDEILAAFHAVEAILKARETHTGALEVQRYLAVANLASHGSWSDGLSGWHGAGWHCVESGKEKIRTASASGARVSYSLHGPAIDISSMKAPVLTVAISSLVNNQGGLAVRVGDTLLGKITSGGSKEYNWDLNSHKGEPVKVVLQFFDDTAGNASASSVSVRRVVIKEEN